MKGKVFPLLLLCACLAPAQAVAPPAAAFPQNWGGLGAAYNAYSAPSVAGWVSYATLLTAKGPVYSFNSWDVTSSKSKPYTAQVSARTGFATVLRQYGPVTVMGFGDAGMATAVTSVGGAFSGGGCGIVRLGKTDWSLVLAARVLKTALGGTQSIYEFGVGRTF